MDQEVDQKPHLESTLAIFTLKAKQPQADKVILDLANIVLVQTLVITQKQTSMEHIV